MANKPGRNEPCPCGSGLKYKYCCISKELKERKIPIGNHTCTHCGATFPASIDLTKDSLNIMAAANIPIMNFCKDNGIYFFGMHLRCKDLVEIQNKLQNGSLKIEDILDIYKKNFSREIAFGLLDCAIEELDMFKQREKFLKDALEAHFDGKYTLSVPTLLAQLEGLLRDYGNIPDKDSVKPTIPRDNWVERLAFHVGDQAEYFNGFISRLYEGKKKSSEFNRNPILHGVNLDYDTEEKSMLLFMAILEIRNFIFMENNLKPIFNIGE